MSVNKIVMAAAGGESSLPPVDQRVTYSSLVLLGEGNSGGQNNTFLDSSANNLSITRNGNVTQGTFSPFSKEAGKWGNTFSVNGAAYIEAGSNNNFSFGAGDFTIEAWVNLDLLNEAYICATRPAANTTAGWTLSVKTSGQIDFYSTGNRVSPVNSVLPNTWTHIAIIRKGTSLKYFVDGVVQFTGTDTNNYTNTSLSIGRYNSGTMYFNGYISNLRITKGAALYTTTFTPSTDPLTTSVPSGTVSLLTCQDNRFKDNSPTPNTLTPYGDVKVTPFSPFSNSLAYSPSVHGGSGYFDGNGDCLTVSNVGSNLTFGANPFTIECWLYPTSSSSAMSCVWIYGNTIDLIAIRVNSSTGAVTFDLRGTNLSTTTSIVTSTGLARIGAWNHLAIVRDGANFYGFVNGARFSTTIPTSTAFNEAQAQFYTQPRIGGASNPDSNYVAGYISGWRAVKGTALYTLPTITIPAAPPQTISNTATLLNFTNGDIIDSTGKNNLETVGNAQVNTTTKKFGNGAMYFDGVGDWLTIPASQNFTFGTGDFTIECWIYVPNFPTRGAIMSNRSASTSQTAWDFYHYNSKLYFGSTSSNFQLGNTTLASSTWYHVAVTRASGTLRLFVNGTIDATAVTGNTTNFSDATTCCVGVQPYGSSYPFTGYIDELRITKGKALYTTNFTPTSIADYY